MPDVIDFLVLRQDYDTAMRRNWKIGKFLQVSGIQTVCLQPSCKQSIYNHVIVKKVPWKLQASM